MELKSDVTYTLTCKSYEKAAYETSGDSASETGTCDGVTSSTFFLKNQSILVGNKIFSCYKTYFRPFFVFLHLIL